MRTLIIAAIVVIVIGGIIGGLILIALASGEHGPGRFATRVPQGDLNKYFDKDASWAATTTVTSKAPAPVIWDLLANKPYLSTIPFVSGPTVVGDAQNTRGLIAAMAERVVASSPEAELVKVGTGVSVPLAIDSFAQRFTLSDKHGERTVTWTVAFTPKWVAFLPMRWTAFAIAPFMGILLKYVLLAAK